MININLNPLIEQIIKQERDHLATAVLTDLVFQTPVDTGAAKANWIVSGDSPNSFASESRVNFAAAWAEGSRNIKKCAVYSDVYIQNNLPYIARLNDGHSLQAPSKYVDRIVVQRAAEDR